MSKQTEAFIEAVGAMAEMAGLLRDALITNGFTRKEACEMVATTLSSMLGPTKES